MCHARSAATSDTEAVLLIRLLVHVLVLTFVLATGTAIFLEIDFSRRMPRAPSAVTGQVIPITVDHGYRVYVSESEKRMIDFVEEVAVPITFVVAGVAALISRKYKLVRSGRAAEGE